MTHSCGKVNREGSEGKERKSKGIGKTGELSCSVGDSKRSLHDTCISVIAPVSFL